MENIIGRILADGMGSVIDRRSDPLLIQDEEYNRLVHELSIWEDKFLELELPKEVKKTIDEYVRIHALIDGRASDFAYMAGVRDAIGFLLQTGLLNK